MQIFQYTSVIVPKHDDFFKHLQITVYLQVPLFCKIQKKMGTLAFIRYGVPITKATSQTCPIIRKGFIKTVNFSVNEAKKKKKQPKKYF